MLFVPGFRQNRENSRI